MSKKLPKTQEIQNLNQKTEDPQVEPSTSESSSQEIDALKAENEDLNQRVDDLEATVLCLLKGVLKVESKFGQKFMARGNFYGIEFK